jgi:hypothetical protein
MAQIIFTEKFRNIMYNNMWSYINPDMINDMLNLKVSEIKGVENEKFTQKHKNTICYKTAQDEAGHYVYVNKNMEAFSTYEKELLRREIDDGVCHGASMIYALNDNHLIPNNWFVLIDYPKNIEDHKQNYKSILNLYIYLITSGLWDKALHKFFYNDVDWIVLDGKNTTKQTVKSLETLKEYIKRFD